MEFGDRLCRKICLQEIFQSLSFKMRRRRWLDNCYCTINESTGIRPAGKGTGTNMGWRYGKCSVFRHNFYNTVLYIRSLATLHFVSAQCAISVVVKSCLRGFRQCAHWRAPSRQNLSGFGFDGFFSSTFIVIRTNPNIFLTRSLAHARAPCTCRYRYARQPKLVKNISFLRWRIRKCVRRRYVHPE